MTEPVAFKDLPFNCYTILRVASNATAEQVTRKYRDLMAEEFTKAEKKTDALEANQRNLWYAFCILNHPDRRRAYDLHLKEAV